jgi:hypothetical protein
MVKTKEASKTSKKLKFYDLKGKKKFTSSNYKMVTKNNKKGRIISFAVAKAPSGIDSWRIVSNKKK